MLKDLVRRGLYASGALPLYHRLRNAHSLTVLMFHRTLAPDDPRWATSDPDYTLPREVFARSLRFLARHYNVVDAAQVLAARRGEAPLPPRALLLTFDDGWADNADHALPELRKAGMPALMFVVSDAVGRRQPFWQERLLAAWLRGALDAAALAPLQRAAGLGGAHAATAPPRPGHCDGLRPLIAWLETLPAQARDRWLAPLQARLDDGMRHMVDAGDLRRLRHGGVALGLHGKSHVHLTRAADVDAELGGARAALASVLGDDPAGCELRTMSFPHGAFDGSIAARARGAGYELLFTSVPVLNDTRRGPGWLLGRTGFETRTVVDARQRFRPDRLAWYLFRKPVRALA